MGGGSSSSSSSTSTKTETTQIDDRIGASDGGIVFNTEGADAGITVHNTSEQSFDLVSQAMTTLEVGVEAVLNTVNKSADASAAASKTATEALADNANGGVTIQAVAKWGALAAVGYGLVRSFYK